ncbi:Glycosyl transferase family 2 [Bryocella elongata]|uniref:Glycosyl transferase family 2 n=1 Tax=Bryocella elongata TaxID=863522 RepID=A0A1H6AX47_9BACT|nr:glycosyltransferase family 2 protein [Bryocella elongata]SEG52376.1 Glycosyl transferase family 2 [Bryocella elongata]
MRELPSLTLSILLVAHAQPGALQRCVLSISSEEIEALEMVVVDDGSPQPIALDLGGIRRPVTLLRNSRRRGLAAARNRAADQALGEVLVFLASDVTLAPGSLRVVERAFLADPLLGVVVGQTLGMPMRGGAAPLHAFDAGLIAVRSSIFREAGGFIEKPGSLGTLEFVMRLAHASVRMVLRPNAAVTAQHPQNLLRAAGVSYRHGLAWMKLSRERRGLKELLSWSGLRDAASPPATSTGRPRWRRTLERVLSGAAFSGGVVDAWLRSPRQDRPPRWEPIVRARPYSTRELRYDVWRPARLRNRTK